MKEAGDGLHVQMNSMMGALQELKLLRVQTALENLDISGQAIRRGMPTPAPPTETAAVSAGASMSEEIHRCSPSPSASLGSRNTLNSSSQVRHTVRSSSASVSNLSETEGTSRTQEDDVNPETFPKRWSGYTAPQVDFCGPVVGNPPAETSSHPPACDPPQAQAVDLPGILYSLSREGPSLDGDYTEDSTDDAGDWTSSLMSRSRNRQPLVLGDNVFADLVGNWLDLPEVEQEEMDEEDSGANGRQERTADRPGTPAHPLRLSRSQEICKKFSLTSNIFKKFLRSVRPDRDKLLKERPGWMAPELQEECNLFKRPKKVVPKSTKGSFYLPFWAGGQQGKGRSCPRVDEAEKRHQRVQQQPHVNQQQSFPGIYLDRRQAEAGVEKMQPLFDYNTAVWV